MKPKTDNTSMGNPPTGTYFEKPKPQTKGWEEKIRTDYKNIYSKEYIDETVKYWGKIVSQAHQQGYREAVEKAKQLTINLIEESYKRGREDEAIECQKDMERVVEETRREVVEECFDWIWKCWNLDLGNLDRAKEHFLDLSAGEKKGKE